MPTITRTFIKTAIAYVVIGMVLSTAWLIHLIWPLAPILSYIQPTALHLIVVGWLTQLIFGVALWMFPPWSRAQPRGPDQMNWACYALLNAGLLIRLVAEPLNGAYPNGVFGWLLVLSALLQVAAILLFVGLVWSRVRAKGSGR